MIIKCIGPVDVVTRCGHWVVASLDYLVMNYPTSLFSVLFGSQILTFRSIFVSVNVFNPRRGCAQRGLL